MTRQQEIAAYLLSRDEGGTAIEWAEKFVADNCDAEHSGDCTKESHACNRCICDQAMTDAHNIIKIWLG